jgi:hypothetical protein
MAEKYNYSEKYLKEDGIPFTKNSPNAPMTSSIKNPSPIQKKEHP